MQRHYGRCPPLAFVDQAQAVAAHAQHALETLVQRQQILIFEETGRVLAARRSQPITKVYSQGLHATGQGPILFG